MTALHKPETATPEGFTKLANERRHLIQVSNTEMARKVQVTSAVFSKILNGQFAEQDFEKMDSKQLTKAVGHMARFCHYLHLDLTSCFEACGIPLSCLDWPQVQNPLVGFGHDQYSELLVTQDIWQKIGNVINEVGTLPLGEIIQLIAILHKNSRPSV